MTVDISAEAGGLFMPDPETDRSTHHRRKGTRQNILHEMLRQEYAGIGHQQRRHKKQQSRPGITGQQGQRETDGKDIARMA